MTMKDTTITDLTKALGTTPIDNSIDDNTYRGSLEDSL